MEDKAFEYKLGHWFEDPIFVDTFTLKENTDLKSLNFKILAIIAPHLKLGTSQEDKE